MNFYADSENFKHYKNYEDYLDDILNLTSLRLRQYIEKKPYGVKQHEFAISRALMRTPNSSSFPLIILRERLGLTSFQYHIVLIALLYDMRAKYADIFSKGEGKHIVPTALTGVNTFRDISYIELINELSEDFCAIFLDNNHFELKTIWETPLLLYPEIRAFILQATSALPREGYGTYTVIKAENLSYIQNEIKRIYNKMPKNTVLILSGRAKSGRLYNIKAALSSQADEVVVLYAEEFLNIEEKQWESILYSYYRHSILYNCILCIYGLDIIDKPNIYKNIRCLSIIFSFIKRHIQKIIIIADKKYHFSYSFQKALIAVHLSIDEPTPMEQYSIWHYLTKNTQLYNIITIDDIVNKYSFNAGEIKAAVKRAQLMLSLGETNGIIEKACKVNSSKLQDAGAHMVNAHWNFDDIIIDDDQKALLKHGCNYINKKYIVYQKWGYSQKLPYGANLSILMEGPPGTGKTMAAQVIANELQLDLYKVDASKTVSKYIGETEENLNKIFDQAQRANVILFIDEMDTFFGKRTEIKDSHDKYANMETSFLLQKIESYNGVLLLATNYISNVDEAFMRRIKFIVHFSLPDASARKKLWLSMFPPNAPVSTAIDFDFLSEKFELSGGTIKNIVLKAAFLAAAAGCAIQMKHILVSLHKEMGKQGKILLKNDFEPYGYLLED